MLPRILLTIGLCVAVAQVRAQQPGFIACQPYGGLQAVHALYERELVYPADAMADALEGEVHLIFVVEADGSVRDMRVWQPLNASCDAEAMRLGHMVRWHPASVGGVANAAEHYLKVSFSIKQYRKWLKTRAEICKPDRQRAMDRSGQIYPRTQVDSSSAPRIPGGSKGLPRYLVEHLRYPPEAYRRDFQGTVTLEFIVEPSGALSNMRALNELGGGCTKEAMELLRSICWRPAMKGGEAIRSTQEVNIEFRIAPNER